jgi:hypothetical protein
VEEWREEEGGREKRDGEGSVQSVLSYVTDRQRQSTHIWIEHTPYASLSLCHFFYL